MSDSMSDMCVTDNFKDSQTSSAKIYCFSIIFPNKETLYLTSSAKIIDIDNKKYMPNSGLNLIELRLDDSAEDMARIGGIFEAGGINDDMNLCGAKIRIAMIISGAVQDIAIYNCTRFEKYDLQFEIIAEPLTSRYATDAVLKFSKTCRATLGDRKCKVDLAKYTHHYNVVKIQDRSIILENVKEKSGYYTGGIAKLEDGEQIIAEFSIISHVDEIIILNKKVDSSLISPHLTLKMSPGCDRKLISCCKKFNNALNFRGEPFVPEFKILEN